MLEYQERDHVLMYDLVATLLRELAQLDPLCFWILGDGRDSEVEGWALHYFSFRECIASAMKTMAARGERF
jgi:hypothetical protein